MNGTDEERKSHGILQTLIAIIIIGACLFGVIRLLQNSSSQNNNSSQSIVDGNGTVQENNDGNTHLFRRSANAGDIVVNSDLDFSSFGAKYTVLPQIDINNLQLTVNYLDKNENIICSKVENLGNVKKGLQVSFSHSIFDLGLSVTINTRYESVAVTGGTVSYFA